MTGALSHTQPSDRNPSIRGQQEGNGEIPYYDVEARMHHKDGHWVWVHDRGRIVEWSPDGRPLRMTGTHEDITAVKLQQAQLISDAETDPLTGLGNRRLLESVLDKLTQSEVKFGLIFIDLDRFKTINDTLGHVVGDQVLRDVAEQIRNQCRPIDSAIRYAGDEFVVVVPEADRVTVKLVARRIRAAWRQSA